jgi:hypothetical protein
VKLPKCSLHKLRSLNYEKDLRGTTHITAVYFGNERNNGLHYVNCGHTKKFSIDTAILNDNPFLAVKKILEKFISELVCQIS